MSHFPKTRTANRATIRTLAERANAYFLIVGILALGALALSTTVTLIKFERQLEQQARV
ncbi:hypothetical protein MRS76_11395 [Rhizobiaceae bacterium n13]|uniref:hypothetical protein n=1 Tax=Ferirhizobium litorale TaxID=2927786 RepID=UPI0024B2D826|nr:hypothetical protein [Fererhizobium litorale]MDI7862566.1 hypothetical protein [Fererhizobium litorale]